MLNVILAVIVVAGLVVLAAVVFVAAGRGGEMPATEVGGYAPLDLGPVSATDVVLLSPPTALWGYNQQATDEALEHIAQSIRERDVRIVALEQLVTDLSRAPVPPRPLGSPYGEARHARPGEAFAQAGDGDQTVPPTAPLFPASPQEGDRRPSGLGSFGPGMHSTGPLGAPVADPPAEFADWFRPTEAEMSRPPDVEQRPWESGVGWPPEVSHD
jgi:hypothetical protein